MLKKAFVFCLYTTLLACENSADATLMQDAAQVAAWQCEARALQKQGFELARRLDNQSEKGEKIDTTTTEPLKRSLYAQRAALSEKISHLLDSLWQNTYKNLDDRRRLDAATEAIVAKNCPN